jgi:hypothetical protein
MKLLKYCYVNYCCERWLRWSLMRKIRPGGFLLSELFPVPITNINKLIYKAHYPLFPLYYILFLLTFSGYVRFCKFLFSITVLIQNENDVAGNQITHILALYLMLFTFRVFILACIQFIESANQQ